MFVEAPMNDDDDDDDDEEDEEDDEEEKDVGDVESLCNRVTADRHACTAPHATSHDNSCVLCPSTCSNSVCSKRLMSTNE